MNGIKIFGLTKKECEMLDTMWALRTSDDLTEWLDSLSDNDLKVAMSLKELLIAHCFDEVNNIEIAKEYLKKFRL